MTDERVGEVEMAEDIIPDGCIRNLNEVKLKAGGQIWIIHKNDQDPFPSNPHAHNAESGLKLDLSTGDLYFKRQRQKQVKAGDLDKLRELATKKGISLPARK